MLRRLALFLMATGILAGEARLGYAASGEEKPGQKRPNILFIFTDDQSWRTLSCYKDDGAWPWVKTPNLDRLAQEGVRFRHTYGAAWCTPSRACVLTGPLPHGIQGLTITSTYEGNLLQPLEPFASCRDRLHTLLSYHPTRFTIFNGASPPTDLGCA